MKYAEGGEWADTHPERRSDPTVDSTLLSAVDRIAGILNPPAGGAALDFGCGLGRWLNSLAEAGWTTFGLDPSIKAAFTRHSELTSIPSAPTFYLVVVSHVLEHLPNPGEVLSALARATHPGGWIYISVPNLDRLPEHRDWHYVLNARTHIAAYSFDCLCVLLGRVGFGGCVLVPLPEKAGKSRLRMRVLARRGATADVSASPLASARRALADSGVGRHS